MAIQWGPRTATINGQFFQLGVDISIAGVTVTVAYHFWADAPIAMNNILLTKTGALEGTHSFSCFSTGDTYIGSWAFNGTQGATYAVGGKATGLYNGLSPSISTSVKIPSLVPGKMDKPTISNITKTSAQVTGKAPSTSSTIKRYNAKVTVDADGKYPRSDDTGTSPIFNLSNLPSNQRFWVWMRAENTGGWGPFSDPATFTTIPNGPAAPTNVAVVRDADSQHSISWTINPTSTSPYASQTIQRKTDSGAWTTIANLAGTATSFVDRTTAPNHRYQWQIIAVNSGGSTPSAASTAVQTTPDAVSSLIAARDAQGNIALTWTNNSPMLTVSFEIQHSADGITWVELTTASIPQFAHVSPSITEPHMYRVRVVSAVGTTTMSAWLESNEVRLAAPPNAPTPIAPEGALDANLGITLQWRHNSVDTSPQSAYALRHRLQGAESWTAIPKILSTASSRAITGYANGQGVEWQAQTWGEHADPSPWSNSVFVLSETPIVTISTPSTTHNLSTLTLAWSYFQAASSIQAQWQAELLNASGVLVETRSGSAGNTRKFSTLLQNESVWQVRLRARSAAGIWSDWEEREFQVSYSRPAAPIISTRFLEDQGAVEIEIENPLITRYSWEGEPHNSASIKRLGVPQVARNRFINPDFEGPYLPVGAEFTTEWSGSGTRAIRIPDDPAMAGYGNTPYGDLPYGTT